MFAEKVTLLAACLNCFACVYRSRHQLSCRKGFEHSEGQAFDLRSTDDSFGSRCVGCYLHARYGIRRKKRYRSYQLIWTWRNVVGGKVDPDEFRSQNQFLGRLLCQSCGARPAPSSRMVYSGHGSRRTKNIEVSKADREKISIPTRMSSVLPSGRQPSNVTTPISMAAILRWISNGQRCKTGELFILQARPETVHSLASVAKAIKTSTFVLKRDQKFS